MNEKTLHEKLLNALVDNIIHQLPVLECSINKKIYYAINEIKFISLQKPMIGNLTINNAHFLETRSSGIAISSQAGSSGFNYSLHGPIMLNEGIIFNQLFPVINACHHATNNPIVLPADVIIKYSGKFNNANLIYDVNTLNYKTIQELTVKYGVQKINILTITCDSLINQLENVKRVFFNS